MENIDRAVKYRVVKTVKHCLQDESNKCCCLSLSVVPVSGARDVTATAANHRNQLFVVKQSANDLLPPPARC